MIVPHLLLEIVGVLHHPHFRRPCCWLAHVSDLKSTNDDLKKVGFNWGVLYRGAQRIKQRTESSNKSHALYLISSLFIINHNGQRSMPNTELYVGSSILFGVAGW